MGLGKIEVWIHDRVLKNDHIRHFIYGMYQRFLYTFSKKIKVVGNVHKVTPSNEYEYLFGYYDKCPWSPNGKYILALKVKNTTKNADSKDIATIVTINLSSLEETEINKTHCWNVQQGCMAEWIDDTHIIFNDFRNNKYVSVVFDLVSHTERIIEMPIYTISQDKKTGLSLDFSRLHRLRPGYGYCNKDEVTKDEKCPDTTCIWKINVEDGSFVPLLKYTDFYNFEKREEMVNAEHKVNHLMISPNGNRFMVLHRWFKNKKKYTRLLTCNIDGSEMYNLSDDDFVSHCCWKNDYEILSYLEKKNKGKGYYLLTDKTNLFTRLWPELVFDGHPTYSVDKSFVVTDTYPDRKRMQSIYVAKQSIVNKVVCVFSPFKYKGNCRCDLHPRLSFDGKQVCFDASFEGKRAVYIAHLPNENNK